MSAPDQQPQPGAAGPAGADLGSVRAEIAEVLGEPVDAVGADDDLIDLGLDSIRLMTLVERWRRAGIDVSFVDLAEHSTASAWAAVLAGAARTATTSRKDASA